MPHSNDWRNYQELVLSELKKHSNALVIISRQIEAVSHEQAQVAQELAVFKVKAGVWGSIGGALAIISSVLVGWWARR